MTIQLHREGRWVALVAVLGLALGACGGPGASVAGSASDGASAEPSQPASVEPEPNDLLVLEWAGYEDPDFWVEFAEANEGTPVDFEFGANDADILAQMQAGSQADVFHFYTGWQQFYVDEGLVQEIDTSQLENWDAVPDDMKALGQVDGVQYYIPWDWGFTSILYNTSKVSGTIDTWNALFNQSYAGHISMWDDGPAAVTVSSYIHNYDETKVTAEQLAGIEAEWKLQKRLNLHYWTGEYTDFCPEVQSGDIWVAYAWQGCYATVLYDQSQPVAYANPKEGRNSWVGLYGISANTESYNLALKFLDDKLASLTCSNAVTLFYYGCANQEVMNAIEDPVLIQAFGIDDPSILEDTNFTPPVTQQQRDDWTAMWLRVKAD
jgi:spermidine/putrescine transport system substrate-binding protein